MRRLNFWQLFLLLCLAGPAASPALAQGGAPMLTDDTGTPGDGHWEITLACTNQQTHAGARHGEIPGLEVGYGLGDRVELGYTISWLLVSEAGERIRAGMGESELGVKWRFLDDPASGLAGSVTPQVTFRNTASSQRREIVDGGTTVVLPFEFQGKLSSLDWNVEVGRSFSARGDDQWLYGLAVGRALNSRLELAVELHGAGRFAQNDDELILNLGTRLILTDHQSLLAALGRRFEPGPWRGVDVHRVSRPAVGVLNALVRR